MLFTKKLKLIRLFKTANFKLKLIIYDDGTLPVIGGTNCDGGILHRKYLVQYNTGLSQCKLTLSFLTLYNF